jgi:hypothetical protein
MKPQLSNQRNRALTRTDVPVVLFVSCLLLISFVSTNNLDALAALL